MRNATTGERGYPWIFFQTSSERIVTIVTTLLLITIGIALFVVYNHFSSDNSPDSIAGYSYAIVGTSLLILAVVGYTTRRRSRKRVVGELNAALNWHICFAVVGIVLLFLHSFGNFNPRTGTYALYGMVALVLSGFIGRALDKFMPRLITEEVGKALTHEGDDRIESITQRLQSIVSYHTLEVRGFDAGRNGMSMPGVPPSPTGNDRNGARANALSTAASSNMDARGGALPSSWDMAYISMEETPQEINRDTQQYRFVPDKKSSLLSPGALLPGAQEHLDELNSVHHALQREQFYRYVIRYWRIFHICLAVVTVALTVWHLEFAFSLLIPVFLHH